MNWDEYNVSPVLTRPGYITWLIYQEGFPLRGWFCYKKLVPEVRYDILGSTLGIKNDHFFMTQKYLPSVLTKNTMALQKIGGHMQDDIHVGLRVWPQIWDPQIHRFAGELEAVPRVDQLDQLVLQAIVMRFAPEGNGCSLPSDFPKFLFPLVFGALAATLSMGKWFMLTKKSFLLGIQDQHSSTTGQLIGPTLAIRPFPCGLVAWQDGRFPVSIGEHQIDGIDGLFFAPRWCETCNRWWPGSDTKWAVRWSGRA